MKRFWLVLPLLILLAACGGAPNEAVVPTLAVLPPTASATVVEIAAVDTAAPTELPSATLPPTETETQTPAPSATATATAVPLETPSATSTLTPEPTQTFTPSLTITNTITPTPSQTFTPAPELNGLGMLALLSQRATILPPEMMYNAETLTAVAFAAETLIAGGISFASSPTPVPGIPAAGTPAAGDLNLGTLPPSSIACTTPPPPSLIAADPTLTQTVGCPLGTFTTTTTAIQAFERGSMIYIEGRPIYVVTLDGRFRSFTDTWVAGVDPETGGETPPLGLVEPKRGFGKVWRNNPDVRSALGWGINEEQGATSAVQVFERGLAIYLPQRGETYLLVDEQGSFGGTWRTIPASF